MTRLTISSKIGGRHLDHPAAQVRALPPGLEAIAPQVPGLRDRTPFSLAAAARSVKDALDQRGIERAHLCGLSLGAMVATRFALDWPGRTASLVLSGGQAHPSRVLMTVQGLVMHALPDRAFTRSGMTKGAMLAVLREVAPTDFRPHLGAISVPTLVLCGRRDLVNLPAARHLAAGIPGAELQVVPGAGHEWNVRLPHEFSARLRTFLEAQSG